MSNDRYNGWWNYSTWRVHLEVFDGMEFDEPVTPDSLEEIAHELVFSQCPNGGFAADLALAFLSDVDWREIAEHVNEYNGHTDTDEEDEE